MIKNRIALFFLFILFQSCDCWVIIEGQILNKDSQLPIERAKIEFLNIKSKDYLKSTENHEVRIIFESDSLGIFNMFSNSYGMCPDIDPKIKIYKEGYQTMEFTVLDYRNSNAILIELKKN